MLLLCHCKVKFGVRFFLLLLLWNISTAEIHSETPPRIHNRTQFILQKFHLEKFKFSDYHHHHYHQHQPAMALAVTVVEQHQRHVDGRVGRLVFGKWVKKHTQTHTPPVLHLILEKDEQTFRPMVAVAVLMSMCSFLRVTRAIRYIIIIRTAAYNARDAMASNYNY